MNKKLMQGIVIMIVSAVFTAVGQLLWKLSLGEINLLLVLGFMCYGCGAICMMIAFSKRDISILHPLMSIGYVISIVLAIFILHEEISILKCVGMVMIILGIYTITRGGFKK